VLVLLPMLMLIQMQMLILILNAGRVKLAGLTTVWLT
jgi:hypothetical protein